MINSLKELGLMKNKAYVYWFLFLSGLYAAIVLFTPTDPAVLQKYSLTQDKARLLTLTVVVPLLMVWLTALYGLVRFRNYAEVIKDGKEGKSFHNISLGLTLLAFSLPARAVVSATVTYLAYRHPHFLPIGTIIKNYANLILPGIGLLYLARGTSELSGLLKKSKQAKFPNYSLAGVIAISSVYTWLITTRAATPGGDTIYYMPNWLILFTLAIPYVYLWCRGIFSVININTYRSNVNGVIYKQALKYLARGVTAIIFLSVLTEFITTISAKLTRLHLTPILLIVYLLVALNALGYGWVARGAKKLKQIEEV